MEESRWPDAFPKSVAPTQRADAGNVLCFIEVSVFGHHADVELRLMASGEAYEVNSNRHSLLYAPRDFDISPYFMVVKPTLVRGFNYKYAVGRSSPGSCRTRRACIGDRRRARGSDLA